MTSPISWLSAGAIEALGWALIHFLWQGAAIAGAAAAMMSFCRRPGTRYCVGLGALALMTAMPVITFLFFDALRPVSLAVREAVFAPIPRTLLPFVVEGWFTGVVLLAARFAGGFLLLERKRRLQSSAPAAPVLALAHAVQQRLGVARAIRYLECGWLQVPAVIGFMRPVILLPVAALTGLSEVQLRAVIAHELAHVRRWDFLVNLFQILAETLLFYHPAIWWLNRRISAERELCCDEIAMAEAGERTEYAHALVLMAKLGSAPSLAMAATHGILSERIFHILGLPSGRPRIAGLAGSLVLLTASLAVAAVLTGVPASAVLAPPIASAASVSGVARVESLPVRDAGSATIARPDDDDYVVPRRVARIRTIKPPQISPISAPIPIALVDLPLASDDPPAVPLPRTNTPPSSAHVTSVTEKLDALDLSVDEYPAPVLKLDASLSWRDWTFAQGMLDVSLSSRDLNFAQSMNYCRDFAVQTVAQGANRPMLVDYGVKQRLIFFYWHCRLSNAQLQPTAFRGPAYIPLGPASLANPVNVSGSWTVSVSSSQPSLQAVVAMRAEARRCSFTQSANTISGTCTGREGSGVATGVIDGRQVRWAWKFPLDDGRREGEIDFIGMVGPDGALTGQSINMESNYLEVFTATPGLPPAQVASQK